MDKDQLTKSEDIIERLNSVSFYFKSMLQAGDKENADMYTKHKETIKMTIELLKEVNTSNE